MKYVLVIFLGAFFGGFVLALIFAVIGVFVSQYHPILGDFIEKNLAQPWSPARQNLIPIHFLVFGLIGGFMGAVLGGGFAGLLCFLTSSRTPKRSGGQAR